jgi:aryl-alcohol dehydrogenase-like predicted oxidoreductase
MVRVTFIVSPLLFPTLALHDPSNCITYPDMPTSFLEQPVGRLTHLSKFIYGTGRLGDDKIPFADRVAMARAAVDAEVWFHTSHTYGDALKVLRAAFDADRKRVPRMIFKIGWNSMEELRHTIRQNIEPLGVDHMDIGQLCLGGALAEDFASGGKCLDEFRRLKDQGLVHRFVLEVFPWTSRVPLQALRAGLPKGLVDGFIFYLNPLQRFASNELWDLLRDRDEPIIAMRTVSGGDVHRLRDVPGAAWKDYLRQRAVEVAPIYERSGCKSWPEFCVRFAFGFPQVRATVGAASRPENLRAFLDAIKIIKPLPNDIQSEIVRLQYRWSDETDVRSEPWSM